MADPTLTPGFAIKPIILGIWRRLRELESHDRQLRVKALVASVFIRSPGVRTTTVTSNPVPLYIDDQGNFGISASTRAKKNIGSDYLVDMNKFLAVTLKNWSYISNPDSTGMGPIADDLDAAGLREFVIYHPTTGAVQGIRPDTLLMGLWSAYTQSRSNTLARLAKQLHQVKTVPSMSAITLGGSTNYSITWDTPFADADYTVVASVSNTSGVLLSGVSAASPIASRTATGCTVQVASGITLLAGQTLTVEAFHV